MHILTMKQATPFVLLSSDPEDHHVHDSKYLLILHLIWSQRRFSISLSEPLTLTTWLEHSHQVDASWRKVVGSTCRLWN